MILEILSRPFCRPKLQTTNPATTVIAMNTAISTGFANRFEKAPPTASASIPLLKLPVMNLTK